MNLKLANEMKSAISSPEEILLEAQQGRMFILSDDEDRENEGDLVIPAQFATPEAINFMAKFGRGLICLAMERQQIERLGLQPMAQMNTSPFQTAFTVSIEAREGVTTGISAADRAHTIQVAISPNSGPQNIVTPGHVFPLTAQDGGVLVRAGQTEGGVDISRLAGLTPASVICEIMNEDGTMARMPDLISFAQFHKMKIGTVADLIAYRRRTETIIERRLSTDFRSMYGDHFTMHIYINKIAYAEHVALVKGDLTKGDSPPLVRMHALNVLEDVLGDRSHGHGGELQASMRMIAEAGRGAIVLLREAQAASLSQRIESQKQDKIADSGKELRDYGVGAQILLDLGIRDMILLSNSKKTIVGLEGYGLRVTEQRPIEL